jgi:AcrR family transcriptional regulator
MPRFSEQEKEIIKNRLLEEGERLFTAYGIKKVSIDELVQATGIAKGSFYAFYTSKEHLFMEIVIATQNRMWGDMDDHLQSHSDLPPRELMKQTFIWMIEQFECYPLLRTVDNETTNYLFRKLPKEVVKAHTREDGEELLKLQKYGVRFACDIPIAAKIMQTIALGFFNLTHEDEITRTTVMHIILDGVLKEIVGDEK